MSEVLTELSFSLLSLFILFLGNIELFRIHPPVHLIFTGINFLTFFQNSTPQSHFLILTSSTGLSIFLHVLKNGAFNDNDNLMSFVYN